MGAPEIASGQRPARRRLRFKVRFWNDEGEGVGFTNDVSTTGAFIEARRVFDTGTRLHLEIFFDEARPFLGECEVVRVIKVPASAQPVAQHGMGVRLIDWSEGAGLATPAQSAADLSVDLRVAERLRRVVDDELKRGGLFVETTATPELGSEVAVTLVLPKPYETVEILTRVVHVNANPAGVGLQVFDHMLVRRRLLAMLSPEALPVDIDADVQAGTRFELSMTSRGQPVQARCLVEGIEAAPPGTTVTPTIRLLEAAAEAPSRPVAKPAPQQPAELAAATAEALRALAQSLKR